MQIGVNTDGVYDNFWIKTIFIMKRKNIFIELTDDNGVELHRFASDNNAEYILKSAYAHDLYDDYVFRFDRIPSSKWYHKNFNFTHIIKSEK